MLRRIVSLGQQASESDDDPMSPQSNDAGRSSESRTPGGLAGVFKGLTGARLTRSPPPGQAPTSAPGTSAAPLASTTPLPASAALSLSSAVSESADVDANSSYASVQAQLQAYGECLEQLRNGTMDERVAAAVALHPIVADSVVGSVFDVWHAAKDLIDANKPQTARHAGWELLAECARQASLTTLERRDYFHTITAAADPSDFHLQLSALVELTHHGRDLSGFDYDVFPILTEWFRSAFSRKVAAKRSQPQSSSRASGGRSTVAKTASTDEERNLSRLFSYTLDLIKYNVKVASGRALEGLLDAVLDIAMNTNSEQDLTACVAVINACVVFGALPAKSLSRCVKVLSSIYCLVPQLQTAAWPVLARIFKTHHSLHAIRILIDTLRNYPPAGVEVKDATRELRGTLSVMQKLVRKAGVPDFPPVPYVLLVDGLQNVASKTSALRVIASILQLINQLLNNGDDVLSPLILDEDWGPLLAVAATCAKMSKPPPSLRSTDAQKHTSNAPGSTEDSSQAAVDRESAALIANIETLLRGLHVERPEYSQRGNCIAFLADVHSILPDSGVELVLTYFSEFRCCFPSDPQWDANMRLVLDAFYANQARSPAIRLRALQAAVEVHSVLELVDGAIDAPDAVADMVRRILARVGDERDTILLHSAVAFAVSVATSVDMNLFEYILEELMSVIKNDVRRQPLSLAAQEPAPVAPTGSAEQTYAVTGESTSNIATRGYARIFMETMCSDPIKATMAFEALVGLAKDRRCPVDARLSALKLLFRLRADWANRIYLVSDTESDRLATVLLRKVSPGDGTSVAEKGVPQAVEPHPPLSSVPPRVARPGLSVSHGGGSQDRVSGPSLRSGYAARLAAPEQSPQYARLWSLPDPEALPLAPLSGASSVLLSHQDDDNTPGTEGLAGESKGGSVQDSREKDSAAASLTLDIRSWFEVVFDLLTKGTNWELYSFVLVHLPSQLSNHAVCRGAVPVILNIRASLCDQIRMNSSQEPPPATGLHPAEVQACVLQILTMILSYHEHFQRQEGDDLMRTFIAGLIGKNQITCVHALSVCCYELPSATSKSLVTILQKMAQIITRQGVAMHILELLASLSRLPWLYSSFREDEYRIAFGVCFRYLQAVRDRRLSSRTGHAGSSGEQVSQISNNGTGASAGAGGGAAGPDAHGQEALPQPDASDDLPQYVYALAYHVLTFWFLALRLPDRASYVSWIASRLFIDQNGRQISDEQAQLTMDFFQRVTYSDADEYTAGEGFAQEGTKRPGGGAEDDAGATLRNWVIGNSIVTIQQAPNKPGWAQIIKRQPSGTSYYTIHENLKAPPPHQVRSLGDPHAIDSLSGQAHHGQASSSLFPSHLLTQLIAPVPQPFDSPLRPVLLPNEERVKDMIEWFDRDPTVDGHKVGVIYVGDGQTDEKDILANISGSSDYVEFLNGLGTLVRLKGATFNTQGLDRVDDTDGEYTFCWRDRVTEIVFHVTTQMPTNLETDPWCINKKRHIGNDFVNIIFNDAGLPFRFDTFPSQFNYVNIVITPESRASFVARRERTMQQQKEAEEAEEALRREQAQQEQPPPQDAPLPQQTRKKRTAMPFYKVQVMSKPGFPEISPAAETKIISLQALPDFIRLLALNASFFSLVWSHRQGGEHISSWRNRLRTINRLRELYGPGDAAAGVQQPAPTPAAAGSGGAGAGDGNGGDSDPSRQGVGTVRDSINSLRRSSMATFFTTSSDPSPSGQRSPAPTATAGGGDGSTDAATVGGGTEAWAEALYFSKWA